MSFADELQKVLGNRTVQILDCFDVLIKKIYFNGYDFHLKFYKNELDNGVVEIVSRVNPKIGLFKAVLSESGFPLSIVSRYTSGPEVRCHNMRDLESFILGGLRNDRMMECLENNKRILENGF